MLKSKRRVHRKLTRKGWKKLAKFSFKVRVTTKDIMKLGCKRKVLIKHIIKKKIHHKGGCRCPRNYSPVCGDGVTYNNYCEARKCAKVKVVRRGKCPNKCK